MSLGAIGTTADRAVHRFKGGARRRIGPRGRPLTKNLDWCPSINAKTLKLFKELRFSRVQGPAVSGKLWDQATDSKSKTVTTGADNASRTHRPGQPIRSLRRARDRPRAEGDVAVAGRASRADRAGGRGSAPTRRSGDRATGAVGRVGLALRASQAASPAQL